NYIFKCNAAFEGLNNNDKITPAVRKQLLGEVYFLRGWLFFYLSNLYGDVPLPVGTDPEVNRLLPRSSRQEVMLFIIENLEQAQELLSPDFVNAQLIPYSPGTEERTRPTKWAAKAMLARMYLYTEQWAKAEAEANTIIDNGALFGMVPLNEIFLKNSTEAIWQLQPVFAGWNTAEARRFKLSAFPEGLSMEKQVYLSQFMLDAFEAGDQRRSQWVDSFTDANNTYYFPAKYKVGEFDGAATSAGSLTEYSMALRLSEQYLIRAEARARQNNLTGAIADLDIIRQRAELPLIAETNPGISQDNLLTAILHERQVELFTEWGHRWFDLKRVGKVDEVMSVVTPLKGGSWQTTDQLMPVPYDELLYNPKLVQTPGY
ncbi:MAG: RagB/SusD family nutrient uptake outer membrane protein, partial [Chitinophagaceae bacterium]|nr:RagB/SusD family nutrient uptake outer membrane protein [Chitinophagaceae bacterium]